MVLVGLVLAVGVANYFLAGLGSSPTQSSTLSPERLLPLVSEPRLLLHVDWGDGSGTTTNDSLEYVFVSEGMVFLVDHTTADGGPRVRWFDVRGTVLGEHLAGVGTTGFAPSPGGFSYVKSQGLSGASEEAALFDIGESRLTTYTVPLNLTAARVLVQGDTVYAQTDASTYDMETMEVSIIARLVPVARNGMQVPDEVAKDGIRDGLDVGLDGRLYGREITGRAIEGSRATVRYESLETSATLTVSDWSQYVGIDAESRAYFTFQPQDSSQSQALAGVTTAGEQYGLVLVGSLDGGEQWLLPVAMPRALQIGRSLFSVTDEGLVVTRASALGVDVMLYEGDFE